MLFRMVHLSLNFEMLSCSYCIGITMSCFKWVFSISLMKSARMYQVMERKASLVGVEFVVKIATIKVN